MLLTTVTEIPETDILSQSVVFVPPIQPFFLFPMPLCCHSPSIPQRSSDFASSSHHLAAQPIYSLFPLQSSAINFVSLSLLLCALTTRAWLFSSDLVMWSFCVWVSVNLNLFTCLSVYLSVTSCLSACLPAYHLQWQYKLTLYVIWWIWYYVWYDVFKLRYIDIKYGLYIVVVIIVFVLYVFFSMYLFFYVLSIIELFIELSVVKLFNHPEGFIHMYKYGCGFHLAKIFAWKKI